MKTLYKHTASNPTAAVQTKCSLKDGDLIDEGSSHTVGCSKLVEAILGTRPNAQVSYGFYARVLALR